MNKEQAYDERISPLMGQIIAIIEEHGIAMVASFAIPHDNDPGLYVSTALPDETGTFPGHLENMRQAIQTAREAVQAPTLHMTVTDEDGKKTMIAVLP